VSAQPTGSTGVWRGLEGMGPVGRDLLAVDWEATPLGPPDRWPLSLQTIVTAVVSSRFSMWMAWGPRLTFFCNDAYRRDTLGVKYPWALGRPAQEVWSEIWPEIEPRIASVLESGTATWDESLLLFLERAGFVEETYHTFSYSPLRDDDGAVAGMLCVVTEDTERVDGQRRLSMLRGLASSTSGLHEETEVLAATAHAIGNDLRLVPFSVGYLFDPDETAAHLAWVSGASEGSAVAPAVINDDSGPWPLTAARDGAGTTVELDPAVLGTLPSGAWLDPPTTALIEPLAAGGDRPYGFVVLGVNRFRPLDEGYRSFARLMAGQVSAAISAARSWEAERRRAEQLAELDAAKTAFFTNVSHELRTPLTLIIGPVADALADTGEPLSPQQRRRLDTAARNADRLLSLVNTLLDFSRLQSGRAVGRFQPTDLAAETAQLCAMFDSAMKQAGLRFDVEVEALGAPVYVDREMWAKIVLNLVSNALKFTMTGGITVTVRGAGEGVELAVTDTGEGISADDQAHLFERFHRVAGVRSRSHEGSGIGLALVAELVGLHGGDVSVTSALGEGSTFRVRVPFGTAHLPADQVHDADAAGEEAGTSVIDRSGERLRAGAGVWGATSDIAPVRPPEDVDLVDGDGPAPTVLVVDDNADMRAYVAGLLAGRYRVQVAVDGADALDRARADPPALVLTDVMMPNLDGFGLLRALRADPTTADVPVVFLSARAGEEGIVEGLEAGADDYLAKPFAAPELLARVKANLELDRSRRARASLERSQELVDQAQRLARVGSWEYDLVSGTVSCSDEHLRLLGATRAEVEAAGRDALLAHAMAPEDRHLVATAFDRAVAYGQPFGYDAQFAAGGGRRWWGRVRGTVVTDPDGRPAAVRGSLQDITDQREAEQRLAAAAATQEAAARKRHIADELQAALLPIVGVDPDGLDVATYYRPGAAGTHVGGDWYDLIDLGDERTALVLGDVMGRGVQAAAIMGQLRAVVRAYARLGLSPAEVLESLDSHVRDLGEEHIVTCVYAVYDATERLLTWANAGHLPPLLVEPGRSTLLLDGNAPPLGTGPLSPTEHRRSLSAGALLALYTDGLVERRGQDVSAGVAHLAEEVRRIGRYLPAGPQHLVDALLPDGPDDDVAILLARVHDERDRPAHSWAYQLTADPAAVTIARRAAASVLATWELAPDVTDQIAIIISELATNAILHGQPPFHLDVTKHGDVLLVTVTDTAPAGPRRLRATPDDEHGRGLQLVDALSSSWGTRPTPNGKTVWATVAVPA
jgi:PAS domain S-box-containing protein